MSRYIQVLTTVERREDAERIARILVEKGLAACVQIVGPITSIYRWRGEVTESREWLCIAKTVRELYREVERTILGAHPYELPEIIAVPVETGYAEYLRWVDQVCGRL